MIDMKLHDNFYMGRKNALPVHFRIGTMAMDNKTDHTVIKMGVPMDPREEFSGVQDEMSFIYSK